MKKRLNPADSAMRGRSVFAVVFEAELLEGRQFLSASVKTITFAGPSAVPIAKMHKLSGVGKTTHKTVSGVVTPNYAGSSTPYGKTPATVRNAYGMTSVSFNGIAGDGTGQTIAIIDAYDYSTAFSDLNAFSSYYGLPTMTSNTSSSTINNANGPTFTKLGQTGTSTLPGNDPAGPYSSTGKSTWEQEEALDIEWAHVMAPKANIVLMEANSSSYSNLITAAVNAARNISGVVAVSMSFGGSEFSSETNYDTYFTTPSGHVGGVGDGGRHGHRRRRDVPGLGGRRRRVRQQQHHHHPQLPRRQPQRPSASAALTFRPTAPITFPNPFGAVARPAARMAAAAGGISAYEAQPTYQSSSGLVSAFSTTKRTYPDLAILGDPATGVPIYDSYDFGTATPWIPGYEGGTSLSCPLTAGIVAVTDQGRAVNGLGSLDGKTGTLPKLYSIAASDFHDVTSGSNGYAAAAGYDLGSGRGSPTGSAFIKDLGGINVNTAAGTVFADYNGDGVFNSTDAALPGVTVYADTDGSGTLTSGDVSTTTTSAGVFTLSNVAVGVPVREVVPAGYVQTTAASAGTTVSGSLTGLKFGNFPTTFALPAAATAQNYVTVRVSDSKTNLEITVATVGQADAFYTVPQTLVSSLTINGGAGDDVLTVSLANGGPSAAKSIAFNAGAQATADSVILTTAATGSAATFTASGVQATNLSVNYAGVESTAFYGGAGPDTLTVASAPTPAFVGGGGNDTINAQSATYAPAGDLGGDGSAVTLNATGSTVSFQTSQTLAALTLAGSAVTLAANNTIGTKAITVDASSSLDLANGGLVVDYTGASPLPGLLTALTAGYAAGAWTGTGIRSSSAAADAARAHALGVAEASDALGLSGTATTAFLGRTVDATSVLVRYTLYGDADLNGKVDFNDFLRLQSNFGTAAAGFAKGNFNYDSTTDFNDFLLLQSNFGMNA